jgi:membrane-associated HD superfamily phosphohydrolase
LIEEIDQVGLYKAISQAFDAGGLQLLSFALGVDYENLPTQSISKSEKAQALVDHCQRNGLTDELLQQLDQERPNVDWYAFALSVDLADSPYKGLAFFDVGDEDLFYGREALTAELVDHLGQHNFLVVVGASGSGKSSLVRAGLIPTLVSGRSLPGRSESQETKDSWQTRDNWYAKVDWRVHIITPKSHPLKEIASSLTRDEESVTAATTMIDDMSRDPRSLDLWIAKLLGDQKKETRLLLLIDQFEELFTLCQNVEERRTFVDNLMAAVSPDTAGRIAVVLTLRADFYHHCAQYENFRGALEVRQKFIGQMSRAGLRRAIEEPAKQRGLDLEEGLVDLLLRDVGADELGEPEPGSLPLLSHALLETWKRQVDGRMTLAGYAASGGVQGAIARTAERTYRQLTVEQQSIARQVFLGLTELGEGTEDTRRRARLEDFTTNGASEAKVQEVLQTLTNARLVTVSQDEVEVAHEALIRAWPTLHQWLDEDREKLLLHRRLNTATRNWLASNRDPDLLSRGTPLKNALELVDQYAIQVSEDEREFLEASQDAEAAAEQAEEEARRTSEGYFVSQWVVASTIGFALGAGLSRLLPALTSDFLGSTFTSLAVGAVVGILVGLNQRSVLRRLFVGLDWWFPATTIGVTLGFVIVGASAAGTTLHPLGGVIVGALVGLCQWFGFRGQIVRAGWWLVVSTIAYSAGLAVGRIFPAANPVFSLGAVADDAISGAVTGIIIGLITGPPLVRLLRYYEGQPRERKAGSQPLQERTWEKILVLYSKIPWVNVEVLESQETRTWEVLAFAVVGLLVLLFAAFVLFGQLLARQTAQFAVGQPAVSDVYAPFSLTYESDVLTNEARQKAAAEVPGQFTPLDLEILRSQINEASALFDAIGEVRTGASTDKESEIRQLEAEGIKIEEIIIHDLLAFGSADFAAARENTLQAIDAVMRNGVNEQQLVQAKQLTAQSAAFDLSPAQERVVAAFAPQFIVPNIFVDEEKSIEAQASVLDAVEPVQQFVAEDQLILQRGDIVDAADLEMLEQLGISGRQRGLWPALLTVVPVLLVLISLIAGPALSQTLHGGGGPSWASNNILGSRTAWFWEAAAFAAILIVFVWAFISVLWNFVPGLVQPIDQGFLATRDIVAPRSATYTSEILTERARQNATNAVETQYTPMDLDIAREQVTAATSVFEIIDQARAPGEAEAATRMAILESIADADIDRPLAEALLALSRTEYNAARDNVLAIIEGAMRDGVVEGQVVEAQQLASQSAAFDLTPTQELVVRSLAPQFIVANIFIDQVETGKLRTAAVVAVEPVVVNVIRQETILQKGKIVDEVDLEKLEALGLNSPAFAAQRAAQQILPVILVMVAVGLIWLWLGVPTRLTKGDT